MMRGGWLVNDEMGRGGIRREGRGIISNEHEGGVGGGGNR